ncbi:unnamed protein product [Rhizophagus irregularis]|nr:hypothetical protein RhiirC2_787094 [Rhizophagus irregularis]CAB4386381.1 unnamed protein product [Rhizophagus irregularis]
MSNEIATLKDQMKWAEKHIKELEESLAAQQKEIENFKLFAEDVKNHNATVSTSINKLVNFQEQRAERDVIQDAQISEILNAVRGQQYTKSNNTQFQQQQQLQFQYIPEQNLNQSTHQGYRFFSNKNLTYNSILILSLFENIL